MSFSGVHPTPKEAATPSSWQQPPLTTARWWESLASHAQPADTVRDLLRSSAPQRSKRGKLRDSGEQPTADLIMQRVHEMVGAAYAESSQGVVASAMEAWGKVNRAYPDRDMIRTPAFTGDLDASIHNEISLMWAGAWMLESGLSVATIATYLSLIKTNFGAHLGWRLTCPQSEVRLPRFLRGLRRQRLRVRRRRVGWRAHHHRSLRQLTGRPTGALALAQDAILTAARQGLLRPCEVAVANGDYDPTRHPSVRDVEFQPSNGGYCVLTILPAKKPPGQPKDEPVLYPAGDGVTDFFSACAAMLDERRARAPHGSLDPSAPLFLNPATGRAFTTTELRALFRGVARAIGLPPADIGAHSGRIGGATDLFASGAPPVAIQIAGRWDSDIWAIYARQCVGQSLDLSRAAAACDDIDLEQLLPSYSQPARPARTGR